MARAWNRRAVGSMARLRWRRLDGDIVAFRLVRRMRQLVEQEEIRGRAPRRRLQRDHRIGPLLEFVQRESQDPVTVAPLGIRIDHEPSAGGECGPVVGPLPWFVEAQLVGEVRWSSYRDHILVVTRTGGDRTSIRGRGVHPPPSLRLESGVREEPLGTIGFGVQRPLERLASGCVVGLPAQRQCEEKIELRIGRDVVDGCREELGSGQFRVVEVDVEPQLQRSDGQQRLERCRLTLVRGAIRVDRRIVLLRRSEQVPVASPSALVAAVELE